MSHHPYVSEVSGNRSLTMTAAFYNEAVIFEGLSIQEILRMYEIDPVIIGKRCISEIRIKLLTWKKTDEGLGEWDEQVPNRPKKDAYKSRRVSRRAFWRTVMWLSCLVFFKSLSVFLLSFLV